jgi:hypothetical protein
LALVGLPVAQASRFETQAQITTMINENDYCTPPIVGDMNATTSARPTSTNKYVADKMYQEKKKKKLRRQ